MERPRLVLATDVGAATVAAVLSPIPLADEVVLFPVLVGLGASLRGARGLPIRWRRLAGVAAGALAIRGVLNLAVSWAPGVAAIANAVTAVVVTHGYARWAVRVGAASRAWRRRPRPT